MNTIGKNITATIFGESHGPAIGITINGLPSGIELDLQQIAADLQLRKGINSISTPRREDDGFKIISGYYQNKTTGTPLTFILENTDVRSSDYTALKSLPRPSHADLGAYYKFGSNYDFRGGGHHSGRLTALLVILGSISKQLLKKLNIMTVSHIYKLHHLYDEQLNRACLDVKQVKKLTNDTFPVINDDIKKQMYDLITKVKQNHDSVGGIIETAIYNVPSGLGEPFFNSVESFISQLIFSIPGVKGIEFGEGFKITELLGSQANDQYKLANNKIVTTTHHNGGVVGGISLGMPIVFKTAIKPTSSIKIPQQTINLTTNEETQITIEGRHDPAIISRVSSVINAVSYYCILELLIQKEGLSWIN